MLQNQVRSANGVEDMVNLNYLHEPAILYNLKQRFLRQIPYTYTGPICIAVNPVRLQLTMVAVLEVLASALTNNADVITIFSTPGSTSTPRTSRSSTW